jgi:mannose-6-phosphate isomerase
MPDVGGLTPDISSLYHKSMTAIPPLRFRPILRQYVWGGRRLAELGKPLGDAGQYAESWEIVDHGSDQSIVVDGPCAGMKLHDLVLQHGPALFGRHHPRQQFPLLFKFLDCRQTLSVQVHPNDEQAARLDPPDLGKTEAWIVLAAAQGGRIYAGLRPGVNRQVLERQLAAGNVVDCLHQFEPRLGDCVLVEAGTVHALGAGLLVAEIQQASDTTYRLFDWNRMDRDGKPRPLHIPEALETIDYARGPVGPIVPQPAGTPAVERLVACQKFVVDRWHIELAHRLATENRFHILAVIEGVLALKSGGGISSLRRGETVLVPACCPEVELASPSRAVVLDMYLP